MAASDLQEFAAKVQQYADELKALDEKNKKKEFKPKFWLQNADFSLGRDVYVAAAGTIGHEVTKFSLVYRKEPSRTEAASICKALESPCEQLLSATKVALFCGAGPSLAHDIIQHAMHITTSVVDLGNAILNNDQARIPELTGRVWDNCKAAAGVSKSNCIASKRTMLQCISMLNDTLKELKELLEEQDESAPAEVQDDDDEFAFDSTLGDDERELFEASVRLLDMIAAILKRGVMALKKLDIGEECSEMIQWTCDLDRSYEAIQNSIVDMGATLYPPIDEDEFGEHLSSLEQAALHILTCLEAQPELPAPEATALETGRAAFVRQLELVQSKLEDLRT